METSHMIVLERLVAATCQLESLALDVRERTAKEGHEASTPSSTAGHVVPSMTFGRDAGGTLSVVHPSPPALTMSESLAQAEDALRTMLGTDRAWRTVGRLETKLDVLTHTGAPGSGTFNIWRSTADLDKVGDSAEDAFLEAHTAASAASATVGDAGEDDADPFGWIMGETDVDLTQSADKGPAGESRPVVAMMRTMSPAEALRQAQEDDTYARETAKDLYAFWGHHNRLGEAIGEAETRVTALVRDLEALFTASEAATPDSDHPLQRALTWLKWSPVYVVQDPAEVSNVWDPLLVASSRGETNKDWRDLVHLCRRNQQRFTQLMRRLEKVQQEYTGLAQRENQRMAKAVLELDAWEDAKCEEA